MKNLKKTMSIVMSLTLALTIAPIPANAATSNATVSTQKELNAALKNSKINKITIKTGKTLTLKIAKGTYSNKTLIVKAAKAALTNNGAFKSISIADAKSFTEKASGNKLTVSDSKLKLTISKDSSKDKLVFNKENANITLVLNGTPSSIKNSKDASLNITNNTTNEITVVNAKGDKEVVKPINSNETPSEDDSANNAGNNTNSENNENAGNSENAKPSTPDNTNNNTTSNSSNNSSNELSRFIVGEVIISNILYQDGKIVELTIVQGDTSCTLTNFALPITDSYSAYDIAKVYVAANSTTSTVTMMDKSDTTPLPDQTIDIYSVNPAAGTFTANGVDYTMSTAAVNTIGMITKTSTGITCVTPITFSDLATLSPENKVTISTLGETGYVDTILVTVD